MIRGEECRKTEKKINKIRILAKKRINIIKTQQLTENENMLYY